MQLTAMGQPTLGLPLKASCRPGGEGPCGDRYQKSTPEVDPCQAMRALAQGRSGGPKLDSVEFKMLLTPERFDDLNSGLDGFWKQLNSAAEASQVELQRWPDEVTKTQAISYQDTEDFALREKGYNLRKRTREKESGNLTLKFRNPDRATAAHANVEADSGLEQKDKFEKDNTYQSDSRTVYSKSNKVKLKKLPKGELDKYAQTFPILAELGIPGDTPLKTVQNRSITEQVHTLGEIQVGDQKTEMTLAFWHEENARGHDEKAQIVEFSFALPIEEERSSEDADRFMQVLQRQAADWLGRGGTKTDYIYSPRGEA